VLAALTALPNLEQLTWCRIHCANEVWLSDSSLLQCTMQLTSLELLYVTAAALQHLGSLTKLQHLAIRMADGWGPAGCPGLQELMALTSLKLINCDLVDLPASVSQLTALQQLGLQRATPTALDQLQVLTGLTRLRVWQVTGLSPESPQLELSGLQHLELSGHDNSTMCMSYLASCTQLQHVKLHRHSFKGPGSLVASTMLQHLELDACGVAAADDAAAPFSWQQIFPGPGQLPHLTYLQLSWHGEPEVQQADIDLLVGCCSSLKVLALDSLQGSCAPALARLPGLTDLRLDMACDKECSAVVQLKGLRQLMVTAPEDPDDYADEPGQMSVVGLRQLAALSQLTSLGFGPFYRSWQLDALAQHLMTGNLADCEYAIINKVCLVLCARCMWPCGVSEMYIAHDVVSMFYAVQCVLPLYRACL